MKNVFLILALMIGFIPMVSHADGTSDVYGGSSATPGDRIRRARGHDRDKEAILSGDVINGLYGRGYNSAAFPSTDNVTVELQAAEDWTTTANGTKVLIKTTPTGTATPATAMTIDDDGNVTVAGSITGGGAGNGTWLSGTATGVLGVSGNTAVLTINPSSSTFTTPLTITSTGTETSVFTLTSAATNDDPVVITQLARGATTDGVATTIWTIDLDANTTYLFEANVVGRRTGGTAGSTGDSAAYKVFGGVVDIAGTATAAGAGTSTAITLEDVAGWTAAFTLSSGNVLLQVTGATDTNVVWHAEIKLMKVAS